jgi:hypothetical protein
MTEVEERLVNQAAALHAAIFPCPSRGEFEHCFTWDKEKVYFWYNTEDQSTHVISADVRR